jgi:hypothetical protein
MSKRRGGTPRASRTYQCPVCEDYFVRGYINVNKDGRIHRETCANCKSREEEVRVISEED